MSSAAPPSITTPAAQRCHDAALAILPLLKTFDDKLIDTMPADALEVLGGRAKASQVLATGKQQMATQGIAMDNAEIDLPTTMTTNEGRTFAILPTLLTISTPKGRLRLAGFLLGVSDDDGKTWKFVDGANKTLPKKLAKFPPSLELPAPLPPEAIP